MRAIRSRVLTAFDRSLAARAFALSALSALVTLVVIVTTDQGAPWPHRLGMVAALAPLAGSIGALFAIRIADSRGELCALAALGVPPARCVRGAVLGGIALAALGPTVALSGFADLEVLFPSPSAPLRWTPSGEGMLEATRGLRLDPGGLLGFAPPLAERAARAPELGLFAIASMTLFAFAAPAFSAALSGFGALSRAQRGRIVVGLVVALSTVVAYQSVAAGRSFPAILLFPPVILLIDSAWARYRGARDE